jgi:lambda family phage tail tape measure protein
MAEQILKVKLVADVGQSEAALKLFTDSAKDAGVSIEKVFKAVNVETDKIAYDIKVTADELDKLDKAFKSAKAKFSEDETTKLSSSFIEVTKNIDAEAARIAKSRQKGFEEDLAKRTTRLKESLSLELALIREGENSITAIKLESASKQRKLEEKLQEDLAAVKQKFIDQDITAATKNTYINRLYADYKDATVKLNELTDERIAKANQEVADFNLVEKKLAETSARRVKLVEDREKALTDIQIAAAKKSQEVQNALIKQTVDSLIITEDKEYKRLLAARKANAEAAFGIGAPQASRDDRGYVPFAMGTVGANRAAAQAPMDARAQTLQEAETRAFLNRRTKAEKEWAGSFNTVVTPAVENNTKGLENNKKALDEVSKSHKSLLGHITEVYGAYQLVNTAVGTFKQFLLDIPKAGIQQEQTQATLFAIFGSKEGYKNIEFLKDLSKSAGQYIGDLQEAYTRFAPSAVLAGATQGEVNKVFKDFTETSTVLHLGTDQVKSLYLALEQMYAKTTVQSEEIKKQLGNVLPGAVEVGAKAWENYINKGKEGAARTKLSVAEFMDAMSKNLVIARQFIPEFSKAYRDTFGGPDDSVFEDTRTKLLSNLQRIRSTYFELTDEIYKRTSSTLNDIVKLGAEALETIQKNATGVLQAIEILSVAVAARLSVALAVNLAANLSKVTVLLTGMSAGMLSVATAAVTAAVSVANLSIKYEEARGILVDYNNETASITSTLSVVLSDVKTLLTSYLETYKGFGSDFLKAILPDPVKAVGDFFRQYVPLTLGYLKATKQAFTEEGLTVNLGLTANQFAKEYAAQFDAYGSSVVTRAVEKDISKVKEYVKGKPVYEIGKEISAQLAAGLKLSNSDITEMLNSGLEIGATDKGGSGEGLKKKAEQNKASLKETYRSAFEEIKNSYSLIQADLTEALGNIDILYQQNAMSIETYFSQKMQLQETDLAVQKEMLNQELQLAYAQKDKVKIQKLNGDLIKAETDANKLATKTIIEKTDAERELQTSLANINAEYAKTFGTTISTVEAADAAEQKFLATNGALILKLSLLADAGDELAASRLKQLYALKDNAVVQEQLNDIETRRNELITEYEAKLQRINNQFQSGALSQLSAWSLSDDAKTRLEKDLEELQAKQQEALTSQGTGVQLSDKVKREVEKSKNYLEDLKTQGSAMANKLEDAFNNSFTNAFTGFANGTMTAKQAFSSLITSMIGEIQKLIAQEMASAALRSVIRPLANWAMSGIGDMFSSGQSAAFTDTFSKSGTDFWGAGATKIWPNANGGVFSGPGISAYSGSIVSKPTIFPFAKGTGLMGEAGPEAILPLTRNSKGKLGVIADSTGQSGSNVYNIAVTVQSSKDEKPADTGQKIAEAMMRTIAKQEIGLAARPGNSLNRTTKFG